MTDYEMMDKYELMDEEWERFETLDSDDEDASWEEDWDNLEMGFNPYEGCYDWDC